jgi:hypothetical protein
MSTKTNTQDNPDSRETIIIVGDDGIYRIAKDDWHNSAHKIEDIAAVGVVNQLSAYGVYLAYIPDDIAAGNGVCCTMVNLQAILKNNPPTT